MDATPVNFVLAEDRPSAENGLRLAVRSLRLTWPEAMVFVQYDPSGDAGNDFWAWAAKQEVQRVKRTTDAAGWNVKPRLLLQVLDRRPVDRIIWVDSDVLARRSFRHLIEAHPASTLIATEEPRNALSHVTPREKARA
ncbi:MAG: hypothetical protein AAF561_04215 [Planctomycetota bacterium]